MKSKSKKSLQKIALFGAGGHAKVILEILQHLSWQRASVIFDEDHSKSGQNLYNVPITSFTAKSMQTAIQKGIRFALGAVASSNALRRAKHEVLQSAGFKLATVIDHEARISIDTQIGEGTVVMAKAVVHPGARIGKGVVVNTGAIIEHDCMIGDYVHIAPGAVLGGGVRVGSGTLVGMNACIRQGLSVGENVTIGAGAAVVSDIPSGQSVVGVPAKANSSLPR